MSEEGLPDVDPCRFAFLWVRISISSAGESLAVYSESNELTTRSSDGELRRRFVAR